MDNYKLIFAVRSVNWSCHPPKLAVVYRGQNMTEAFRCFEEFTDVSEDVWVGLSLMQGADSKTLMIRKSKKVTE